MISRQYASICLAHGAWDVANWANMTYSCQMWGKGPSSLPSFSSAAKCSATREGSVRADRLSSLDERSALDLSTPIRQPCVMPDRV